MWLNNAARSGSKKYNTCNSNHSDVGFAEGVLQALSVEKKSAAKLTSGNSLSPPPHPQPLSPQPNLNLQSYKQQ